MKQNSRHVNMASKSRGASATYRKRVWSFSIHVPVGNTAASLHAVIIVFCKEYGWPKLEFAQPKVIIKRSGNTKSYTCLVDHSYYFAIGMPYDEESNRSKKGRVGFGNINIIIFRSIKNITCT